MGEPEKLGLRRVGHDCNFSFLVVNMSALDQMRAQLDQLMGTSRDGEESKYKVRFDDPRVCKSFLLACCPHEILSSTRMDLGECPKIHDLALKADYEMASKNRDYYFRRRKRGSEGEREGERAGGSGRESG